MRANTLPDQEEITGPLKGARFAKETVEQERSRATSVTELFLREPIKLNQITTEMRMGRGTFELDHFPVRNLQVEKAANYTKDERLGLIFAELVLENYMVKYETGYLEGELPALMKELILHLTRYRLTKDESHLANVPAIIEVGRRKRNRLKAERDGY